MEEPSVLDYVKSKLNPRRGRVELPAPPPGPTPPAPAAAPRRDRPWRALLALMLALAGQRFFEPGDGRSAAAGLALYALALGLLVWSGWRNEWGLADPAAGRSDAQDDLRLRGLPLVLSLVAALLAFLSFGRLTVPGTSIALFEDNRFTALNVSLWLLAIGLFLGAAWRRDPQAVPWTARLRAFLAQPEWRLHLTRWSLLVLAVVGLVVFFRLHRLESVPVEPFSDHAEKLLDVYDLLNGWPRIFFERNSGREAFHFYWTALIAKLFGTGLSFFTLKLGTALLGLLTLPYVYLLGRELGGRRVALFALLLTGVGYWPNMISRVGLRFPLYPLFLAPVLYHSLRGLRDGDRNQLLLAGLFLGLGLHGYSSFRIVPLVVVFLFLLYLAHPAARGRRTQALGGLVLLAFAALLVFLPLMRYSADHWDNFSMRVMTRMTDAEKPLSAPPAQLFARNLWNAARMFHWDDGEIWVAAVTHRPALDLVSAALFTLGAALAMLRYVRTREWVYLFLLLSIPLLQLPSSLALAFPNENPSLTRAGGALIPAFLLAALALDGLLSALERAFHGARRSAWVSLLTGALLALCLAQNYDLVFRQYAQVMRLTIWNSSDMGRVIAQFKQTYGSAESAWIVAYPYWVDTRLPALYIGEPTHDLALWPQDFERTLVARKPLLFLLHPADVESMQRLQALYPQGALSRFASDVAGHDFMIFFVPEAGSLP